MEEDLNLKLPNIDNILNTYRLPRDVIASNEEIQRVWAELPREIKHIPVELRDGLLACMCVSITVGLFDGAINYIWNAVILNLRTHIKNFGLLYIAQALNRKFEEEDLKNINDYELLDLSFKLEIFPETNFFFLNHCRNIHSHFASVYPSIAKIDDRELVNFIGNCFKYGINIDSQLQGISISTFIDEINKIKFHEYRIEFWSSQLKNTFSAQRVLLIPMLHRLYCDLSVKSHTRLNSLALCLNIRGFFDTKIKSLLIEQHNQYLLKKDKYRIKASKLFFKKLILKNLLRDVKKHSIIKNACDALLYVHQGHNNFYNEPSFACKLYEVANSTDIPESVKEEFVEAVITCYVGSQYGVPQAAVDYYEKLIRNFKQRERGYLLGIIHTETIVSSRINTYHSCKDRYLKALDLINKNSLSAQQKNVYEKIKQ